LEMCYINHRIYARTLDNVKRSEYVALFNENPDVRVLLIDIACGALGLNLNAASVVLIVNPINRPGIEAQAIKRAHRIGQTRRVMVETLVLENTIEHAIFDRAKKMSRTQHQEAKELEDDEGIREIIQRAQVLKVLPEEEEGENMFAKLKVPRNS
jgi:SNF2 family DNA or RNA helicase